MEKLRVGDLILGEGMPEICIPLMGTNQEELLKEAELAEELPCSMVEWRADYVLETLKDDTPQRRGEKLKQILGYLRMALEMPVIFTIRTAGEGGQAHITKEEYFIINQIIAQGGMADFIDIEAFDAPGCVEEGQIRDFIDFAHENGTRVLLSSHDFKTTPDMQEMLARFFVMQELGGDMIKLAVMPEKEDDVFALLEVASLMRDTYGEVPFIAISMGQLGATTRICGGEFGSAITFAAGKGVSAPGQLDAVTLKQHLDEYYAGKRATE